MCISTFISPLLGSDGRFNQFCFFLRIPRGVCFCSIEMCLFLRKYASSILISKEIRVFSPTLAISREIRTAEFGIRVFPEAYVWTHAQNADFLDDYTHVNLQFV